MSRPKMHPRGQSKAEIDFLARPAKELILPTVTSCNVQQDKAVLVFRPDGSGTLTCVTGNRDPHRSAVWYTDFSLQDAFGKTLFGIGPFFSPTMPPHGASDAFQLGWTREFDFPAAFFAEIATASQNVGCFSSLPTEPTRPGTPQTSRREPSRLQPSIRMEERSRTLPPALAWPGCGLFSIS